jgi:molecular chaperone GrpE
VIADGETAERRQTAEEAAPARDPAAPAREAEEAAGSAVQADLDRLLEDVRRERDEYLDLAKRAQADFENYRKRVAREATDAERRGRAGLAGDLLPAIDNLERALGSAGVDAEAPSDDEGLAQGVALVLRGLRQTLARAGVEVYDPVGEPFDPSWHEALSTRPGEASQAGTVLETIDKGYRLDGQVLRPARVIVSE